MKTNAQRVAYIISLVYYLAVGLLLLFFFALELDLDKNLLITLFLLTALPALIKYIVFRQYKDKNKIFHIVWAGLAIVTSIILFCLPDASISHVCIFWGAFDIVRAVDETYCIFFDGKFKKDEIPDLIIAIVDFALGIILIIKLEDGLNVHLIAATVSVFVFAIEEAVKLIQTFHEGEKNEKDS